MTKVTAWWWVASVVVTGVAAAAETGSAPGGSVQRGKQIYHDQLCQACHGTVGQGGGVAGPKIAPNPFPWPAFEHQVRKPHGVMPPYTAKNLADRDLEDIYAYVASIKPGPAAKDIPLLNP